MSEINWFWHPFLAILAHFIVATILICILLIIFSFVYRKLEKNPLYVLMSFEEDWQLYLNGNMKIICYAPFLYQLRSHVEDLHPSPTKLIWKTQNATTEICRIHDSTLFYVIEKVKSLGEHNAPEPIVLS